MPLTRGFGAFVRKTADETVNNSDVLQDDDELTLPVAANATYVVDCWVVYDSNTTPDIKFAFTGPASATMEWTTNALGSSAAGGTGSTTTTRATIAGNLPCGGVGAGTRVVATIRGLLMTAGTAGSLTLQWAQNTADATETKVRANSWMRLVRVA